MCGIAGIIDLNEKAGDALVRSRNARVLEEMISAQAHRGPDDLGLHVGEGVYLGHNRLSIIDLSQSGHQPMANEDSSLIVIHNGEIYNYLELRRELEKRHTFRSTSDTEVILHAYEEWGEGCLNRFNGMWAFAILDLRDSSLFCSRDRFGVKPFYYYLDDEAFVFASEIKSLLRHPKVPRRPNDQAIFDYLVSGYGYMDISDYTFFENVRQVKPGHFIRLSLRDKRFSQTRYWGLDPAVKSKFDSDEEACERFRCLFRDAVRLRLRSDVPLGVSLSGGLDSSSIACVAAELLGGEGLETFSSCFDEQEYDERRFIASVLDKTKARPNLIFTKPDDLFREMDEILWHQDEPYSTLSIFPQWCVMRLARARGVKVLLTGQGGDETLAGYHKYYFYLFADLLRSLKLTRVLNEMGAYKKFNAVRPAEMIRQSLKILASYSLPDMLKNMLKPSAGKGPSEAYLNRDFLASHAPTVFTEKKFASILNNDLYNGLKISPLPSLLHIDDRSSMAHSVESRSPFLDYRLVEFLFSLGPEYKIRGGLTKYILRQSLKGLLPEEVRLRRDKMGFATPLELWLKTSLKGVVFDIITSRRFAGRPYFNQKAALEKFKDFIDGKEGVSHYAVWSWVNLELWLEKFMDAEGTRLKRQEAIYDVQ